MTKAPNRFDLGALVELARNSPVSAQIDGKWYPARPLGLFSIPWRIATAWAVFTGKADAVYWPAGQ